MKAYKIKIASELNTNINKMCLVKSEIKKGFLMDMLCPLTPYQVTIEELDVVYNCYLNLEDFLVMFQDLKLETKIAKNVVEVTESTLATFKIKPELNLNIWHGDIETRTYINNISLRFLNDIFPNIFKFDSKTRTPYFEGELYLEESEIYEWRLYYRKVRETVVYETIVLEK